MKTQKGSTGIALLHSLTTGLVGVGGQCHAPAALPAVKGTATYCAGSWVGPQVPFMFVCHIFDCLTGIFVIRGLLWGMDQIYDFVHIDSKQSVIKNLCT
jgi:hypothetical protein